MTCAAFELAPGVGNIECVLAEHGRRQLDAEVLPRQRGDARQSQRGRAELIETALDQLTDMCGGG